MKRTVAHIITALVIAACIIANPTTAEAMPTKYHNQPTFKKGAVTYLVAPKSCNTKGKAPSVFVVGIRKDAKHVTIPAKVRHAGKTYRVTTIWSDTLSKCKRLQSVTIKANIISAEDVTLWRSDSRHVVIMCTNKATYKYLRNGSANVAK